MHFFDAIVYGVVQGLTEYLPVSSSAHLILVPRALGTDDPGLAFDVFLHLGTLLATLSYFWRDWREILLRRTQSGTLAQIVVATLPALLVGALIHKVAGSAFRDPRLLAFTLALGGVALYGADRFCPVGKASVGGLKNAFYIGLFQCLALVPGMSRSGSTMMGGRILGINRETSARFSFLISGPVTAAAVVFELRNIKELVNTDERVTLVLVGGVFSFIAGIAAIGWLLKVVQRIGFQAFMWYRLALAGVLVWVYF